MAINLPAAYSKVLDKGYALKSLTAPAFKARYEVVGGTTKTFKIYSTKSQPMRDYTGKKLPANAGGGVGTFGYEYKSVENEEQIINATQDKYFAGVIDKADAKFSKDGSLDTREFMRVQMEDEIYPMLDKYNISSLVTAAGTPGTTSKAVTKADAYETFIELTGKQTNARVPRTGRVAFASVRYFNMIKLDDHFTPASEMTAKSRRSGNYGEVDGVLIIEVPDDYLPTGVDLVLTHEKAAAAPKHLADYNQGEFKESASGYYANGRVVHDAFVLNKKKGAINVLKITASEDPEETPVPEG